MSDLQIGLAMLGGFMVVAVLGFNWWQERQFRRRSEETFANRHGDILLEQPAEAASPPAHPETYRKTMDEPRIEPRIDPQMETGSDLAPAAAQSTSTSSLRDLPLSEIDYIVEIRAGEFIAPERLGKLRQDISALGRKVSFSGLDYQSRSWEPLSLEAARYTWVRAALQLVDRSGPVSGDQMRQFGEAARAAAQEMAAIAELPDFAPSLERAVELDDFCAEVDVLVGINVIARTGQIFQGTKIRALAEASGLQLQQGGVFHFLDDQGGALFSLDNQGPEPFLIEKIRGITTSGITFLLDVPRTPNGMRAFDRMVVMSRSFADALDGMLADDNRVLLNDAGLDKIRGQLRAIYAAMEQRGIQAGSPLALRLFS